MSAKQETQKRICYKIVYSWPKSTQYDPSKYYSLQIEDIVLYHIEAETKWKSFFRRQYQTIFKANCCSLIQTSLKFVPNIPINNTPAVFQIMSWYRTNGKP